MEKLDLKQIFDKLSVIKGYKSLFPPLIIFIIALLVLIPAGITSKNLQTTITGKSVSLGDTSKSLAEKAVSKNQYMVEEKYCREYADDMNNISRFIIESSHRKLLSYKIFPEPSDSSTSIYGEFGENYRNAIRMSVAQMDGTDCPDNTELGMGNTYDDITPTRKPVDQKNKIKDLICRDRAQSARIYLTASNIPGFNFWQQYEYKGTQQAISDCWYWQITYWMIEDVLDSIEKMNSNSRNVFDSPVKRLINIDFTDTENSTETPFKYVIEPSDALINPHTKRFCDSEIDVVQFHVTAIAAVKHIPEFMSQLCTAKTHKFTGWNGKMSAETLRHNQITILQSHIKPVYAQSEEHELYRYGEDAVAELKLTCEYIFDKEGYTEIKPEAIKIKLGEEIEDDI